MPPLRVELLLQLKYRIGLIIDSKTTVNEQYK